MASLLQQLHGDDALLLMYLVGELPAVDRAEVERRLAVDAKLQAELERLTEAHWALAAGLEALDGAAPMRAEVSAAVRRASTAIRQWQARPAPAVAPGVPHGQTRRWRVWGIPSAAAAIVLAIVGVSLYNGSSSKAPLVMNFPVPAPVPSPVNPQPEEVASLLAMTTPTAANLEFDALAEIVGPGFDRDATHEGPETKAPHEDGGYKAVFDIPLDAGQ